MRFLDDKQVVYFGSERRVTGVFPNHIPAFTVPTFEFKSSTRIYYCEADLITGSNKQKRLGTGVGRVGVECALMASPGKAS